MALAVVESPTMEPVLSLAKPSFKEASLLDVQLVRERAWYADQPRLQTQADIGAAVLAGELVEFTNTDDIRRISRFDRKVEGFEPYLTPQALRGINDFGRLWRVVLWEEFGIQDFLDMLAVTSMTRSQVYQDRLVASSGKLASPDSTHCTGNAWDVDVSAYYRLDHAGNITAHSHLGRRSGKIAISQELAKRHGDMPEAPSDGDWYNPLVTDAAVIAAELMYLEGSINLIKEFPDTPNACLHMAINPDY